MDEIQDTREKIVQAALDCAAEYGWGKFSFIELSDKTGLEIDQLYQLFNDLDDVLYWYERQIDVKLTDVAGQMGDDECCRDRLFDVLMERFDILNSNRAGLISVLKSFEGDLKQAIISLPNLGQSMTCILELSGFDTSGMRGAVRVAGLSGVYGRALLVWMHDESPDMARVMATLDGDLRRAETVMNFLSI